MSIVVFIIIMYIFQTGEFKRVNTTPAAAAVAVQETANSARCIARCSEAGAHPCIKRILVCFPLDGTNIYLYHVYNNRLN